MKDTIKKLLPSVIALLILVVFVVAVAPVWRQDTPDGWSLNEDSATLEEGDSAFMQDLSAYVDDDDPDQLVYTTTQADNSVIDCDTPSSGSTLECFTVKDQFGSSNVTVRVADQEGFEDHTFTLTVNSVNDPPTLNILDTSVDEDSGLTIFDLWNSAADVETADSSLTFTVSQSTNPPINCTLNAGGHNLSCATVTNQSGTNTVQVTVTDGSNSTAQDSFTITVNPQNDPPEFSSTFSIADQTAVEGVAWPGITIPQNMVSDIENNSISVDQGSLLDWMNLENSLKFSGTPSADDVGEDTVALRISDGQVENSLSDLLNFNITVKPALEIIRGSVEILIDGEPFTLDDELNVTPGEEDIIVRYTVKNNFNKKLGGVAPVNKIFMDATIVGEDDPLESKIISFLNSGDTTEFETTDINIPSTVGSTYELELKVSHTRKDGTVFDDLIPLEFTVLKEEADVLITDAELIVNGEDNEPLTCSRTASLELEVANTGNTAVNPGVLVYTEEQFNFDPETGKFEGEELVNRLFDNSANPVPLAAQDEREVTIGPLDLSGLDIGQQSLFVYLVDVDFDTDTPFIGDQEPVPFDIESCLTNPDPDEMVVQYVRPNVPQRFSVDLDQLNLKSGLKWFIGAAQQRLSQGKTFFQKAFTPGTHNVKVEFTNPNDGYTENVSWTVIATNRPQTTGFSLPNFDETKNPASYSGFAVENSNGKIVFNQAVNLLGILDNGLVLDNLVTIDKIGSNPPTYLIAVDAAAAPGLAGRSATITLPSTFTNPLVLKLSGFESGELSECPATSCTGSNQNGKFVFTVSGFSTYIVMEEVAADLVVLPTEVSFDNVNAGQTVNTTITISNTGTIDALTGLSAQFVGVNASFNPQVTGLPATLEPGDQKQLQLTFTIPTGEPSGKHSIGTLHLVSDQKTKDVPLFINPKSFLTVKSVKINGKSDGKFQLDEPTTVKVEVKNDHNQDMEDVQVTVTLKNINDEEVEEESDLFDLKEGKDDDVELTFDLRNEDVTNEQFTMEIVVEGEDKSGNVHRTVDVRTVQLDLENHNVIVKAVTLESASLQCQRQTLLKVTVQNIGKSDEDDVEIRVRNTALGLNMVKLGIDLDDFASEDNEHQAQGTINAEDAPAGLYPITVEVYRDGKLEDTEEVSLEVKTCGQLPGAGITGGTTGTTQPPEQKKEVVIDVASQKLAEELQKQLAARKAAAEQPQPATITSFRESGMYLPLLGVFVALVFLAVVLGLVVLVTRK